MKTNPSYIKQQGMTLIEVMIAVTISLVLLAGVMQIFLSTKQTYRMQDGISRIQENARFGLRMLEQTIRMAGYNGCSSGAIKVRNMVRFDKSQTTPDPVTDFTSDGLEGHEYADLPIDLFFSDPVNEVMATLTTADVLPGTDILIISHGSADTIGLEGNLTSDNANIKVSAADAPNFNDNDVLFISDCEAGDVFAVASANQNNGTITHSSTVNFESKLSKAYGADAVLMKLEKSAYYIGTNTNGVPALFRRRMVGQGAVTEELIEGVENLQLNYGEDTDGDSIPNRYVSAANVTDFANVSAVRIGLLVHSPEEIQLAQDTRTYQVLDTLVDPVDDGRTRRLFTSTVKIRNKGAM